MKKRTDVRNVISRDEFHDLMIDLGQWMFDLNP